MKVEEKKKVNKAVGVVMDPTYFNEIPLAEIMGAIEGFGYLVVDEEHNRRSGSLCGREGQAMFDILSKETGKLDNSNRRLSWYTMPSGRYEVLAYSVCRKFLPQEE
jgi:hypothetical protein